MTKTIQRNMLTGAIVTALALQLDYFLACVQAAQQRTNP